MLFVYVSKNVNQMQISRVIAMQFFKSNEPFPFGTFVVIILIAVNDKQLKGCIVG
jgi:hypothetical protein